MPFYNYEDRYVMKPTSLTGADDGNEVQIACKTKNIRIYGYISEGIKINGSAKWKEMFNGGIGGLGKGLLQTASNLEQIFTGITLQQPWMNRKFYESTAPFSFTFGINFVSHGDAANEVYMPAQYLLSLIYPRKGEPGKAKGIVNSLNKNTDSDSLVAKTLNMMGEMVIPGPSVGYTGSSNEDISIKGDTVTIVVGQMFAFGAVYLEDVSVEFSPTFDSSGYPLYAKCSVKATCMDSNYCTTKSDGTVEFLISQFKNGQCEKMSGFIDKMGDTMKQAYEDAKRIQKTWKGFFGIGEGK